ncbi:putative E3 ubiquitin-protein ligase XBAT31 [Primulina huaijiensis]|uniref:putative E3 ubiquitin-protein ligase XBAT31 n=1 Tax=Primulina huaijiensis TaxID=1492673 RepID=UPI003CC7801E
MGQGMICTESRGNLLFSAVQNGELRTVEAMADANPTLLTLKTDHWKLSAMHVAAANGQIEVLSMLLHRTENPDIFDRHKQVSCGCVCCLNDVQDIFVLSFLVSESL